MASLDFKLPSCSPVPRSIADAPTPVDGICILAEDTQPAPHPWDEGPTVANMIVPTSDCPACAGSID